jgi:hypothetical protein
MFYRLYGDVFRSLPMPSLLTEAAVSAPGRSQALIPQHAVRRVVQ